MPASPITTPDHSPASTLRRAVHRMLAYALAATVVALNLPAVTVPLPLAAFMAKPAPVVARTRSFVPETAP